MKHASYYVVMLLLWGSSLYSFSDKSFLAYRSQGFNLARSNSGWLRNCTHNNASVAVEYTRSFDQDQISKYFFGCNELTFSGSRSEKRGANDILADYYGLPTDFKSTITFSPIIRNIITDFDFYWNVCSEGTGFNLRVLVPLAHTEWELNPCEQVLDKGSFSYPAGYMSNQILTPSQLPKSALQVLSGEKTFGDLALPLQYGRIVQCKQKETKFADVLIAIGYNFICDLKGLFGINGHVVIPTGTRSHAINLFEPQIGNGHHWALGAGINSRYTFKGGEDDDFNASIILDAYVQHLFKTTQKRSYDFTPNGPGSRYMLLEDMIRSISIAQGFSPTPGEELLTRQYITRLVYGADAATFDSTIKVNVQADIIAKFSLQYRRWNAELGYNFWGRSKETLVCRDQLQHQFYGVKGDAQVYGFLNIGVDLPLPINATQSKATIHAGQGDGNTTNNFINSNADNPALMYNVGLLLAQSTGASVGDDTGITAIEQVNGSNPSIVLNDDDINNCSGLSPRALSHTVFASVRYEFETSHTKPYLLLGAEGEFGGKTDCVKTAISQWGVWVKGGINY